MTSNTLDSTAVVDLSAGTSLPTLLAGPPDGPEQQLACHLRRNGWCFVKLPPRVCLTVKQANALQQFFAKDPQAKAAFSAPLAYGYSALAEHKEGFRVLTGHRLLDPLPTEFKGWLQQLIRGLDDFVVQLLLGTCKQVFGMKADKLARACDLPVGYKHEGHFGMLDFAHYFNRRSHTPIQGDGSSVGEVNCVPHSDPGLLSISFFSNRPGLQFKEAVFGPDNQQIGERWVDGPVNTVAGQEDIGVMWLGDAAVAATNGQLKAGIHRVIYPQDHLEADDGLPRDRLTGWYEVCTTAQALELEETDAFESEGHVSLKNMPTVAEAVKVNRGERHFDFLTKVERVYGIPIRKSRSITDMFKSGEQT